MTFNELKNTLKDSKNKITIYEIENNQNCVESILNIPNHTLLGTIIYNTKLIIVSNIIRVFGNIINDRYEKYISYVPKSYLIVADDVFGGLFALTGTTIMYFAPDTLEWENFNIEYSQFISWVIIGDIISFYSKFINDDVKKEIENVDFSSAIQFYPFPWSKEFDINTSSRKVISSDEIITLNFDMAKQI